MRMDAANPGPSDRPHWYRPGLDVQDDVLHIAGRNTLELAAAEQLPAFITDLRWIGVQANKLHAALANAGLRPCVRLALKAQREPETLRYIRKLELGEPKAKVGIDACSPDEVDYALESGWEAQEISCTGTNMSDSDLQRVIERGVHLKDGTARALGVREIDEPADLWPRDPPIRVRKSVPDSWLEIGVQEGRNRMIRRMTAAVGLPTLRLIRWQVGPWALDGLKPGESRSIDNRTAWQAIAR
mgnify:CR=1 FL=1